MNRRLRAMGKEDGAAMVEFALVVPLLLTLVFGIIEFGVFFYDRAMLTNASREAARTGVLFYDSGTSSRPDLAALESIVNDYCASRLVTFGDSSSLVTTTSPPLADLDHGEHLTVQVAYHYDFLVMPGFLSHLVGGVDIVAAATMRAE